MFDWLFKISINDKIYVSLLSIVAVILLTRFQRLTLNLKPLLGLTLLHLGVELLTDYLHFGFKPPLENLFLYHLLTPLDYLFVAMVFYRTFTNQRWKRAVFWSVPAYWGAVIILTIFYGDLNQVNDLAILTESLVVTGWCFLFFRSLLLRSGEYVPEQDPTFWIIVATLFYFVGTIFIFGSLNYFLKNDLILGRKVYFAGYTFYYLLYGTIGVTCLLNFPVRTYER